MWLCSQSFGNGSKGLFVVCDTLLITEGSKEGTADKAYFYFKSWLRYRLCVL